MAFTRSDMCFTDYKWSARAEADDPRVSGAPDSTLLDRNEGYEVLYFVNAVAKRNFAASLSLGVYQKIERMIRLCPSNLHAQKQIESWVLANWSATNP